MIDLDLRRPEHRVQMVQNLNDRQLDADIAPHPNVTDLLGVQGVGTAPVGMDDEISGLTLVSTDCNILVTANKNRHILRRRFVDALSMDLPSRLMVTADIFDEQTAMRAEGGVSARTRDVRLHDVVRMVHHFGVSCAAIGTGQLRRAGEGSGHIRGLGNRSVRSQKHHEAEAGRTGSHG